MINNQKIAVVLPAYNAEKTLERTYSEIPLDIVDEVILVDDASPDKTFELAKKIGIRHTIKHQSNLGYGGNQKSCYQKALDLNADIIVMLHPDYQYTPKLIPSMAYLIYNGVYDIVLGSRIIGKGALKGGMPFYKFIANRLLTGFQNLMLNQKLSEYHTGYRAFSGEVLRKLNLSGNSDDFVFDNELLAQIIYHDYKIGEISCPTKYEKESSSISFVRSVKYGVGVLGVCLKYRFTRWGLMKSKLFI